MADKDRRLFFSSCWRVHYVAHLSVQKIVISLPALLLRVNDTDVGRGRIKRPDLICQGDRAPRPGQVRAVPVAEADARPTKMAPQNGGTAGHRRVQAVLPIARAH